MFEGTGSGSGSAAAGWRNVPGPVSGFTEQRPEVLMCCQVFLVPSGPGGLSQRVRTWSWCFPDPVQGLSRDQVCRAWILSEPLVLACKGSVWASGLSEPDSGSSTDQNKSFIFSPKVLKQTGPVRFWTFSRTRTNNL